MKEKPRKIGKSRLLILAAIIDGKGFPPTFRQLADLIGTRGVNAVLGHVKALEKEGLVTRVRTRLGRQTARGLVPLCKFMGVNELGG